MGFRRWFIALFWVSTALFARDTAILIGLSCDPDDSAFGMSFYNWRVGLKNLGWFSEVFCGPPGDGRYSSYRKLQEGSILDLLEEREKTVDPGDNFFVFINDHGHERTDGQRGQILTGYDDQGESCPLMPTREMAEILESIDAKNGDGTVWVLNSSCHSGAFLEDLSEGSGVCVATNAGTWSQSFQEDFVEILGWNLAAASQGGAKNFDYLEADPGRLAQEYPSYAMKDLLSTALLKDKITIAMFTNGLGLNALNRDSYEEFTQALGTVDAATADALGAQSMKDRQYLERRARGEGPNYFAKFPAREARNRIMSERISRSNTACAIFDLNRRRMLP